MSSVCLVIPSNPFDQYFIQLPLDAVTAAGQLRAAGHSVTIWDQRLQDAPAGDAYDVLVVFTAIADRAQCYPSTWTRYGRLWNGPSPASPRPAPSRSARTAPTCPDRRAPTSPSIT
ncbi:hypothetical protein [Streptomyces sp. Ac-502]|uniref:hypothetical protein n=1 Tax=Streptomyces sp. Ac-502 TaxID=3342801 RepID=UPI003862A709